MWHKISPFLVSWHILKWVANTLLSLPCLSVSADCFCCLALYMGEFCHVFNFDFVGLLWGLLCSISLNFAFFILIVLIWQLQSFSQQGDLSISPNFKLQCVLIALQILGTKKSLWAKGGSTCLLTHCGGEAERLYLSWVCHPQQIAGLLTAKTPSSKRNKHRWPIFLV